MQAERGCELISNFEATMARIQSITDKQKVLQGSKRFIKNVPDAKPIDRLWPAPADLKSAGRKFHKKIGNILVKSRVLTELDRYSWFELCYLAHHLSEVGKVLEAEGYVCGIGERCKKHPAANVYKDFLSAFSKLCEKFGLSPADRRRIDLPVDKNPKDSVRDFLFNE
jgi:P27 family predicted phage terminase small subunit